MKGNWNDEQAADKLRCLRGVWLRELERDADGNGYSSTASNLAPKEQARRACYRLQMAQAIVQVNEAIDVLERPSVAPLPEEEEGTE